MKKAIDEFSLNQYLPNGALYLVLPYLEKYAVHLVVKKERQSILGNYIYDPLYKTHKITINENLNPQAFLVTLLHELAHLVTFEKYKNKVKAHGVEWKLIFKQILQIFIAEKIFYYDVEQQLLHSIEQLKASSCADLNLAKVLKKYDKPLDEGLMLIQDIQPNELFLYQEKRIFKMIGKEKKRFKCEEVSSKKIYLFYALCTIKKVQSAV